MKTEVNVTSQNIFSAILFWAAESLACLSVLQPVVECGVSLTSITMIAAKAP